MVTPTATTQSDRLYLYLFLIIIFVCKIITSKYKWNLKNYQVTHRKLKKEAQTELTKNNKVVNLIPNISINVLNINDTNISLQDRDKWSGFKNISIIGCHQET